MLTSLHLHIKKSSEVSIKTRSTPASLSIQGQDTKHTTVKWSISRMWVASYADALWACHEFLPHERLLQRALTSVLHQLAFVLLIANDKLRKNAY